MSALPVLEGEGRVVGVVSEADLLRKEEFRQDDPQLPEQLRRRRRPAAYSPRSSCPALRSLFTRMPQSPGPPPSWPPRTSNGCPW
ncbi:CBS domain-containing protein [Streptomyces lavendulae]